MPVQVTIYGCETSLEESKNYEEFFLIGYSATQDCLLPQKNMVMSPNGTQTKNNYAGERHQQFTAMLCLISAA
jgi:hypothetical protein